MASSKNPLQSNRTVGKAGGRKVRDSVGRLTVHRTLALLHEDDLPRRRLDSLLLLASGLTPDQASKQTGLSTLEVVRLRDSALGMGIAHALLFGDTWPASTSSKSPLPSSRKHPAALPQNHANRL